MKNFLLLSMLLFSIGSSAQLSNGSTAPDFTLTDINGVTHHLYDYLDQGITVYIDCFAAHCPGCWAYHNQHHIEDLYSAHGPQGLESQNIMVLAVEQDPENGTNELFGISGNTLGNWIEGTTYPIINPEGAERLSFISDYAVNYYPLVYSICPDRSVTITGTVSSEALFSQVSQCSATVSVQEGAKSIEPLVRYHPSSGSLQVSNVESGTRLTIFDITGKNIQSKLLQNESCNIQIENLMRGVYLCRFESASGKLITRRFVFE